MSFVCAQKLLFYFQIKDICFGGIFNGQIHYLRKFANFISQVQVINFLCILIYTLLRCYDRRNLGKWQFGLLVGYAFGLGLIVSYPLLFSFFVGIHFGKQA